MSKRSSIDTAIEELTRQRDEVRVFAEHKVDGLDAAIAALKAQQQRKPRKASKPVTAHSAAPLDELVKASKPVAVNQEKAS